MGSKLRHPKSSEANQPREKMSSQFRLPMSSATSEPTKRGNGFTFKASEKFTNLERKLVHSSGVHRVHHPTKRGSQMGNV